MQYFLSDYMEGAHPLILERLTVNPGTPDADKHGENSWVWN